MRGHRLGWLGWERSDTVVDSLIFDSGPILLVDSVKPMPRPARWNSGLKRGMHTMTRQRVNALLVPALLPIVWGSQAFSADIAGLRQMYDGAMLPDVDVAKG
jgi:hypothetical protein